MRATVLRLAKVLPYRRPVSSLPFGHGSPRPAARAAHGQTINDPRLIRGSSDKEAEGKVSAAAVNLAQFDASKGLLDGAKVKVSSVTSATDAPGFGFGRGQRFKAYHRGQNRIERCHLWYRLHHNHQSKNHGRHIVQQGQRPRQPGQRRNIRSRPALAGTAIVCASSLAAYVGAFTCRIDHEYLNLASRSRVGVSARGRRSRSAAAA